MEIKGKMKIYRKEFNGRVKYSTRISWHPFRDGKEVKDEWEAVFVPVMFAGNKTNLNDGDTVEVLKGFISGYTGNNGNGIKFIVQEFDAGEAPQEEYSMLDIDAPF